MPKFDILAIGELNVDLIMTGFQSLPVSGREIIGEDFTCILGSSTAICACVMANLGLSTTFYGKMGKDAFADVVKHYLHKYNVDTGVIVEEESRRTGITVAITTNVNKDRSLATCNGDSIDEVVVEDITDDMLRSARHMHVGAFFLQSKLRKNLVTLFKRAKDLGLTTSLDCSWDETNVWDYDIINVLKYTDIFFPNEGEALNIAKAQTGKDYCIPSAAEELAKHAKICVVKCGPMGAYLHTTLQGEEKIIEDKPFDAKVVDTTGAGDSFNAGFLYAYLNGKTLEECMTYGNASGSVSVTRMGGTSNCPNLKEVEETIKNGFVK